MDLHQLVSDLIIDTKGLTSGDFWTSSLGAFLPELTLCVTIVLMLLVRVFNWGYRLDSLLGRLSGGGTAFWLTVVGSGLGLFFAAPWSHLFDAPVERMEIFTGMLVYDSFTIFMRSLLLAFAFLFAIFTWISGIPDREDGPDIYTLVLGATLGMCLMASANHLLMVFMAVEMASVPSYALAGMLKGRKRASEAALKYSIYGAGTAGIMLYGISLVAGLLNTAHLPTLAVRLAERLPEMIAGRPEELMVLMVAGLMIMIGLAFKLSAVPFHFWCPDVFEGASAEVDAFLSVASKAAALGLLVRVAIGFGTLPPEGVAPGRGTEVAQAAHQDSAAMFAVADQPPAAGESRAADAQVATENEVAASGRVDAALARRSQDTTQVISALSPARLYIGGLVGIFAFVTCTFGNLAAYGQTNMKRLLAYSTIAHAGYMMMAVPPVMALAEHYPSSAQQAVASLAIYMAVYLFMNLGAFAVVAFLRNAMRSEEIADYAGLVRRCPGVVICLAVILFSLVGLPPLAGFIGKFAVFAALTDGYQATAQTYLIALLVAGGVNTAISLFYYLRVVKIMTMSPEPETRTPFELSMLSSPGLFILVITLPTVGLIFGWDFLNEMATMSASQLVS